MENLNAENIINEIQSLIKALKECGGWVKRGNGEGWFNHEILADALALITSQEQRIGELTEENESLKTQRRVLAVGLKDLRKEIKAIKADTVRKVADLLWQGESEKLNISVGGKYYDKQEFIDQIAKEMLEGQK